MDRAPDPALELAYVGLDVPDRAAFDAFLGEVVGLVRGDDLPDGSHAWRNDDRAYRLALREGGADATYLGFEATSADAFVATIERLRAAGHPTTPGTDAECDARRVVDLAWTTAPWGPRVEIVRGLEEAATPFASPLVPGGFLTEGMGFGHAVFFVPDLEAAHGFATALGLTRSDWLHLDLGRVQLEGRFYHCNPRHHSLAVTGIPVDRPQKLHHLMLETNELDDVGAAYDRALASGAPIPNGLGRHDNDEMLSFYVTTPAGFQIELGHGARRIDDPWTDDRRYDRISRWGHQPITRP